MQVEVRRIADLTADPENARTHDKKNLDAIASSLEKFGQRKPIVVMPTGVILAGNGTWAAAKQLGWTEITVSVTPKEWDYATAKAYALADNRTAELAEWDTSVLASQLIELDAEGWDITALGFDLPETPQELNEDEGPLTFDEEAEPITKLGDVYQLGRHRLMCGDSSDPAIIAKLMQGNFAELVLTDPPYKINNSKSRGVFQESMKNVKARIDSIVHFEPQPFLDVLPSFFEKGMNAYIFTSKELVPDYLNWARDNGYNFNILTWHKTQHVPFTNFTHYPDTEYLIYVSKTPVWNTGLGNYQKYWVLNNEKHADHPTIKPQEILIDEIKISSNPGGIVVDPFGGSGSTLIACEQTNRTCYMMELDPKYCDVIVKRWEALTGKKAELL